MIFLSNAAGEITAAIPETINQGSIGVNKIVLIAPFPANSVVSATFTLPNGIKIYPRYVDGVREENYPYLMGVVEKFGDEGLVIDGVTVNAWQLTLDKAITQIAGKVTVQFLITTASGGVTEGGGEVGILPGTEFVLATTSATLPINRGNAYISPSVAPSQFELIEQYLAAAKLAEENAKTSANTAKEFYMDASAEADRAAAEADRAKLEADRYSPWDVVANQETALVVLNGMANTGLKSYLFLNVDFTELNLNSFINGDGIPQINIANSIEKLEFRGCTFESVQDAPLALKFFYQGSQCSISGAKGDELVIQGFTDVIDCRAKLIHDCEYVTACDAVTIYGCESVTDTTASLFKECIFVDPFTVIGFVPSEDVGKVATLTDDGTYKPERLAKTIRAVVNPNNFKIRIAIDDVNGIEMSGAEIDLPLESVVVGANVSEDGTKLILTLQNGNTVDVPIADIFRGVATEGYVNDTVGQAIDNLKPYDVETEKVNLGYQQTYLKLTIDNLLDGNYESFQPFDMVCVGSDGYPLSSLCTVTVEQYDEVRMLVYDSKHQTTHLYPQYYLSEDGNVYLYFSTNAEYLQVFIRGLVEKCTGATLEIVDTLPSDVLDISIEKHITEDYVSYTANGVTQKRPIGNTNTPYSIVCRTSSGGINVRTPASGAVYTDTEAVNYKYLRDVMLPEALANAGGGGGNANIDVTAEVGQTIIVKEVDANGKPTKWESADYQERICWTDETVILPETTEEAVDDGEGLMVATLPEFTLVGRKKYLVNYNGTEYECECAELDMGDGTFVYVLGNMSAVDETFFPTGEPFVINTLPSEGLYMLLPLDGATTVTVSIIGDEVDPIPQKYVTNAFPYYIDITGTGTTDDPYVCANTVAEVVSAYSAGRLLTVRVNHSTTQPFTTLYLPHYGTMTYYTTSGQLFHIFEFFYFSLRGGVDVNAMITEIFLTPKADGTYKVTENYPDFE